MRLSAGNESHSVSGNGGKKVSLGIMTLIHAQLWLRLNRIPVWGLEGQAEAEMQLQIKKQKTELPLS